MNRSGETAAALRDRWEPSGDRLVVVVDDADLALGRIRIRPRGGSGGHNGLESVAAALGTEEFARVRVGVAGSARPGGDLADYVLAAFEPDETRAVDDAIRGAADAIEEILADGVGPAMNRWNGRVLAPAAEGPDEGSSTQS
jgi:PTH1 family peptidyl-tRNA hydrolase